MARTVSHDSAWKVLETPILTAEEQAEIKKENGNSLFKKQRYEEAAQLYSDAIDLSPSEPVFYGNRSACYRFMGNYNKALDDAKTAVKLNPNSLKSHVHEIRCWLLLGDISNTRRALQTANTLPCLLSTEDEAVLQKLTENCDHLESLENDFQLAYQKKDFRKCVYLLDRSLETSLGCIRYELDRAECLAFIGRCKEAQEVVSRYVNCAVDPEVLYVRGVILFYQDMVDRAMSHFQQVLRLAPDHKKAQLMYRRAKLLTQKKQEGNAAFNSSRLEEAYSIYTDALEIDPLNVFMNAKLYFNRALVSVKQNKFTEAIKDCTKAIELDESYLKAYLRRAKCYMEVEMYREAIADFERVCQLDNQPEYKHLLSEAKTVMARGKPKDYYKILGVDRTASEDEIRKAYKKLALVHHPDRHVTTAPDLRDMEEKKFKELSEAYEILSDRKARAKYDYEQRLSSHPGAGFGSPFCYNGTSAHHDPAYNGFQVFYFQ